GINLIDTSPYYGNSEQVIGLCLKQLASKYPRHSYFISTKVGRYGAKHFDYSRETVRNSVLTSLKRLNTGYLDFVYCHDVEFVEEKLVIDSALKELFLLKEEGFIHNVGISGYPLKALENIAKKCNERNSSLDCLLTYCHYTIQNSQLIDQQYITKFQRYNIRYLFNASPLSMGLLSGYQPPEWHPASENLKNAAVKCKNICNENSFQLPQLALAYSLNCPSESICSTIIGCISTEQIKESMNTLKLVQDGFYNQEKYYKIIEQCKKEFGDEYNHAWPSPPLDY
ncbi:Aldo/keto reductase, partial [Neoconidiobolus thromboides FSU 785]